MNEKFLSRGKREDTGKWVEGYYVELPEDQRGEQLHIIIDLDGQYNRIVPETVGRCTGLTDKNGKTIFENDIVSIITREPWTGRLYTTFGIVKWKNGGYFVVWINSTSDDDFCKFLKGIEVVGNVSDNPELIGDAE